MAMAPWRAALRHRGLWGKLGDVDHGLSLNLGRRPQSTVTTGSSVHLCPAPCEEGNRGAIHAAEYALGALNSRLQKGVSLTTVVRARELHMAWSIYSDRKGDVRLYHARVVRDVTTRMTCLIKCVEVDDHSFSNPSISQPSKHLDLAGISQGYNDCRTPWESVKIIHRDDAIVPVDISEDEETEIQLNDHAAYLLEMLKLSNRDKNYNIKFERLICASKADISGGGGVLYSVVLKAIFNGDSRSFVAVIKSTELLTYHSADTELR